eukprot:746552-Hanusia_phi.AAC.1
MRGVWYGTGGEGGVMFLSRWGHYWWPLNRTGPRNIEFKSLGGVWGPRQGSGMRDLLYEKRGWGQYNGVGDRRWGPEVGLWKGYIEVGYIWDWLLGGGVGELSVG